MCGIYELTCNTCKLSYVTDRQAIASNRDINNTITQNDPHAAFVLHNLNNNHEYGPIITSMTILKQITKTSLLIPYEQLYIQSYYYHKQPILEQNTAEINPIY